MTPTARPLEADREKAIELFREAGSFLLAGHVRPDGDCVGSQGALARVLQSMGKDVTILNPDHPGEQFHYFYDACPFGVYDGGRVPDHDVCVLLDINELSRCGDLATPLARASSKKVVVDHHPHEGEPWWDASFVDVSASATGVLVWRIAQQLGCEIDEIAARALFTSIVTDTGWFRYSNTDAETLALAGELTRRGVSPDAVFSALYQTNDRSQPEAIARVLARTQYFADGRLAVVDHPLDATAPALRDTDTVLDVLRAVGDVQVVLYVRELEQGMCKLSARSKTDFDVNALARRFGGGGHVKASGASIEGGLEDVRARLIDAALDTFAARNGGGR